MRKIESMKKAILFWVSCWSLMGLLFLPFPFAFLPQIGVHLSNLIFPLNKAICSSIGVDISKSFLVSDSLAFYSTGFILFFLSGIITFFLSWKWREYFPKMQLVIFAGLVLLLSYFLIHYGLDKLFGVQFYTPASNTIYTPVGQLDKDILFWTSMGTSLFYNQFMAISEILAGIFLLFSRTRFLGLIIGFGILLNVFAINIGFDITVKYVSGILLLSSSICLCFYASKLSLFIGENSFKMTAPTISQKWTLLLFVPFVIDLGVNYWDIQIKDSGKSYVIESVNGSSQLIDVNEIIRIHIHPEGYFVLEDTQQQFTSYKLQNEASLIVIQNKPVKIRIRGNELLWKENETELSWKLKSINLENVPVKRDKIHWYFEKIELR